MSNRKKTIVFISNESKLFGAPKVLLNIVNYFQTTQRYDLLVVCPTDGPFKTALDQNHIRTLVPDCLKNYYIHVGQSKYFLLKLLQRIYDNLKLLIYFIQLSKYFPDSIIYTNTSVVRYIAIPALLSKAKLVWHIHEYFNDPIKQKFHSLLIENCADKILLNSPDLAQFMKFSKKGQQKTICLKYFPVLEPKANQLKKSIKPKYDLIFAGRISLEKGVLDLLKAAKKYLEIKQTLSVFIIGLFVDKDKETILTYFEKNNLDKHVTFHDFDVEVNKYILDSKVVVLPSYRESMPLILGEAVMLEKPVICTDVGNVRSIIVHNKNGVVVEPGNVKALTDAMKQILEEQNYKRFVAGTREKKKEILSDSSSYKIFEEIINNL